MDKNAGIYPFHQGDMIMFRKTMKKIACLVLATASITACVGMMTGCETNHPEVEMQLEFNGKTYTLEYKLYRKIAPSTVNHFLWLAENGYYDGLCVHNYAADSKMVTGGYTYSEDTETDGGLTYKPYYETVKTFTKSKFPANVWKDSERTQATYTLFGEFEDNQFTVTNGDLNESFGSLSMYYYTKSTDAQVYTVYQKSSRKGESRLVDYKYNSATSLFYISLLETEKDNTAYCTFATLEKDSVAKLQSLQDAIEEYADADDFTTSVSNIRVETDDPIMGEKKTTSTFAIPKQPIVIKKVTVKKY